MRVDSNKSWILLKEKLCRNTAPGSGSYPTSIQGLSFHRYTSDADPKPSFFQPVIIVVAQGRKLVRIGNNEHYYGENSCFISGIDMPITSCTMDANEKEPYLSMSLYLDTSLLTTLTSKIPCTPIDKSHNFTGAVVQDMDPDLLDAFLRLVELAEKTQRQPVIEELLLQEIHYRLLLSPFGQILQSLNTFGSQGNQIIQAVSWLKENYRTPFHVNELARKVNMASSTFHKYFKQITTLSPLQYQKQLRLNEAQSLMLSNGYDVTQAAFSVGYESATQFIREYKRLFGEAPRRDIVKIKNRANKENIKN